MKFSQQSESLREALEPYPRWRLFGEGTATATFEFGEPEYAAGFVTRAIEQARAFQRIPHLSLAGITVKLTLAVALGRDGLAESDQRMLDALERAANHPGRPAPVEEPIISVIADRWSPLSFSEEQVPVGILRRLFEAARWSSSSFNEQPWRFVVVTDDERRAEVAEALVEGNAWARAAPVLVLVAVARKFARNKRVNKHAPYDTGAAVSQMVTQATTLGLVAHQMAGFDPAVVKDKCHVPDGFEPMAMMALGYWGEGAGLDEELQAREESERVRHPLTEVLFWQDWGQQDEPAAG
jgi:nitroreductase/pterin-4a-carbinolamine dehydratase